MELTPAADRPVVLRAPGALTARFYQLGGDQCLEVKGHEYGITLYRSHLPPGPDLASWHPAHWWGSERRFDQHGRAWTHLLQMVTDDFGMLVAVPQ